MPHVNHDPGSQAPTDERLLSASVGVTVIGGLIIAVEYFARMPPVVAFGGAALFVVGLLLAGVFGFRVSRRTGAGFALSLVRGLRTLLSWLWHFTP